MQNPMEMNPWFAMWTQPRSTVRSIIQIDPRYGFWILSSVYALSFSFFIANFYSWGLSNTFAAILLPVLILSPLIGYLWLSFEAAVLRTTSRWFGGTAPYAEVKTAVAWANVPYFIALLMWVVLMVFNPSTAFIQYATGTSALFIILITLIIRIWAFVLLIQAVSEVESLSLGKSILSVILEYFIVSVITLIAMYATLYVYINLINSN